MTLPQKASLAGQISFYMRIIFGDVTCRCLSAIWVLPTLEAKEKGRAGNSSNLFFFFFNHRKVAQDSHSSFVEPIVCQADSTDSLLCKTEKGKNARNCEGCVSTSEALGAVELWRDARLWQPGEVSLCPGALQLMYLKGLNTNPVLLQILKGAFLCVIIKTFCNAGCGLLF